MKLFPPDPASKKKEKEETTGSLAGEVVFVASNKDVRDWKKAGEWCVLCVLRACFCGARTDAVAD